MGHFSFFTSLTKCGYCGLETFLFSETVANVRVGINGGYTLILPSERAVRCNSRITFFCVCCL